MKKQKQVEVKEGHLMGIGNPLLDISAVVGQDVFDKYDVQLNNAILAEAKHEPIYEELVKNYKVDYVAGGATQNSIRVAQWLLSPHQPNATTFVGSIGKGDAFGEQLTKAAKADGVNTLYYESDTHKTGTCAVLIKDGERSLVANLSAANEYAHDHTESKEIQEAIEKAQIYYAASFFLTVPQGPKSLMHIAEHAHANKKTFAMNLSAPFLIDFFHEPMMNLIKYADFVFCNESEAAAFAKKMGWDEKNLEECALKLSQLEKVNNDKPRTVVFTQGSDSTIVVKDGKTHVFPVSKLDKEKLIDTNGAGDSFVGGFLAVLAQGNDAIEEAVNAGHSAASYIIQESGCTIPKKAFELIEA